MLLVPLLASLALAAAVMELVRRRRLREEFSWLWVGGALGALVLSASQAARDGLAELLNMEPANALLAVGLVFMAGVCLDISTKVSKLANQQKNLAQDLARLDKRLSDLERDDA